jgi:hypothetical protein
VVLVQLNKPELLRTSGSVHLSRTMMSYELGILFSKIPIEAELEQYRTSIIDENVLAKKTIANRRYTARHIKSHYSFDLRNPAFRLLRVIYDLDPKSLALLACMYTVFKDSLFRFSSNMIMNTIEGQVLDKGNLQLLFQNEYEDRYTPSMLNSLLQNIAASWTQSGHLQGRIKKYRMRVNPTPATVSYALSLGYLDGKRGSRLFDTIWMKLMDRDRTELEELAFQASKVGIIDFRKSGNVVDLRFDDLLARYQPEDANE